MKKKYVDHNGNVEWINCSNIIYKYKNKKWIPLNKNPKVKNQNRWIDKNI